MCVGESSFDDAGSISTIHAGHLNVHQHHVSFVLFHPVKQVAAIVVSCYAGKPGRTIEHDLQSFHAGACCLQIW